MFRLIYQEPSSRWQSTKQMVQTTPQLFNIVLVYDWGLNLQFHKNMRIAELR